MNESPTASVSGLTLRSVMTGMVLGGALSLCNIYSGLKIGFTTNMSIATALLGYGLWRSAGPIFRLRCFGLHENLINQTAGSAAASIAGAGLVAPIPALTMLTGRELAWEWLSAWALSVSVLGVLVGLRIRRRLIVTEELSFPYGVATAEMLRDMYGRGREAAVRLWVLLAAMGLAGALKCVVELLRAGLVGLPGTLSLRGSVAARHGLGSASLKNLGFGLDPGVLMIGLGALIGMRACASMLLGALLAWGVLAPAALQQGWVVPDETFEPDQIWFTPLAGWMLWSGVALMVSAALTSFALSMWRAFRQRTERSALDSAQSPMSNQAVRRRFAAALLVAAALAVLLQMVLFEIQLYVAISAVALTFVLAIVAGRVTGETGIAPIGAMGKVTQLTFAVLAPGNATANLMSANVTGGAASQCSDMLHDLKTGHLLGASPSQQGLAQLCGVVSGALCGSAGYLLLVENPNAQLITAEWPAPAVAQWKAVAEVFSAGISHMPPTSLAAAIIAAVVGALLAVLERTAPKPARRWIPSAASVGLAFVLPAHYAISVFLGGVLALLYSRLAHTSAQRFAVVIATGLIAGESLVGVVFAL